MHLQQLALHRYRNLTAARLVPGRYLTILYGQNGQGKTNLLESIVMLGSGRSFRAGKVNDLIQHGEPAASVTGRVIGGGVEQQLALLIEGALRRYRMDGKVITRAADLHGKLPVVVFAPDDLGMVKLGPETRRRYLDRSLYAGNAEFLQDYHTYYRTLKQRNALLKSDRLQELAIWTEQLAAAGVRLMEHRLAHLRQLLLLLRQQYSRIAGDSETVDLRYAPDVAADQLVPVLERQLEQDLRYKTTLRGPHRDDLLFLLNDRPLRQFGSQGQQRSFVLALKLAELDYLRQRFGEEPLLLLDDIASELDRQRRENLLQYLRQREVQTLITTTDITPFQTVLQHDSVLLRVEAGTLTYEGNGLS